MIYDNFILQSCPNCENETIQENHNYCKICGSILKNRCAGETEFDVDGEERYIINPCGTSADNNARFCTKCGCETTYCKLGILTHWQKEYNSKKNNVFPEEEIPF